MKLVNKLSSVAKRTVENLTTKPASFSVAAAAGFRIFTKEEVERDRCKVYSYIK